MKVDYIHIPLHVALCNCHFDHAKALNVAILLEFAFRC